MGNKPSEMVPPTGSISHFCESTISCLHDEDEESQLTSSLLEEYFYKDDKEEDTTNREGCRRLEPSCWIVRPLTSMQRLPLLTVASDDSSQSTSSSGTTTQGSSSLSSSNALLTERSEPITEQIFEDGTLLESQGKFDMAFDAYQRCLHIEERSNTNTTLSARAHFKMGHIHWRQGTYNDSLCQLEQAASIYQQQEDRINYNYYYSKEEDLAKVFLAMGKTHASLGNRQKAVEIFEKALSVLKKQVSSGSLDDDRTTSLIRAQVLHALGEAHESMGDSTLSLWYLQDAITIQFRMLGQNHVDIAATLLSFGPLLEKKGYLMDAMACFEYALEIYCSHQDSYYGCSVDMAVAQAHLGWIHYLHGRLNNSLALYNDALERLTSMLGPRHRNVASILVQMGMVYHEQAELQRALSLYQQAHDIQLAALGNGHEDVAHTLCLMSSTHKNLGNFKEARELVDKALRIYRANHVKVDNALVMQATTLRREIEAC